MNNASFEDSTICTPINTEDIVCSITNYFLDKMQKHVKIQAVRFETCESVQLFWQASESKLPCCSHVNTGSGVDDSQNKEDDIQHDTCNGHSSVG